MDALIFLIAFGVVIGCIWLTWVIIRWQPKEPPPASYAAPPSVVTSEVDADGVYYRLRVNLADLQPGDHVVGPDPRESESDFYLRKWTAARKLDAQREQESWQKTFNGSLR